MYHALTCLDRQAAHATSDNDKHSDHKTSKKKKTTKTNNNKIQCLQRGGGGGGGGGGRGKEIHQPSIHTADQNI